MKRKLMWIRALLGCREQRRMSDSQLVGCVGGAAADEPPWLLPKGCILTPQKAAGGSWGGRLSCMPPVDRK